MHRMIQQVTTIALSGVLVAGLVMFPARVATATTKNWINSSGDWSDGANWSGGTAPGINDIAIIAPNDGVARTINFNSAAILTALYVDLAGPGTAATTFSMPNGSDLTVHNLWAGGWNGTVATTGRGVIDQSTGIVSITPGSGPFDILDLGVYSGSTGTYNLSGGTLQANAHEYVGDVGTGFFNHTGGTNSISGIGHNLYIGGGPNNGVGTYTISNSGSLLATTGNVIVGNTSTGTGTLTIQNQASVDILNNLTINSHGTVNLNGGTLRFNTISGITRLTYTSGTIQLAGNRDIIIDGTLFDLYGASRIIPSGKGLVIEGTTTIRQDKSLTVSGGTFTSQGLLTLGAPGLSSGDLIINSGGKVAAGADVKIDAFGIASVSGAGSSWTVAGNLQLSPTGGRGDLSISNQGSLYISNTLSIGSSGFLTLGGGTIRFNGYSRDVVGSITYTTGMVQLAGNRTLGSDAATVDFFGASPTIPTGKALVVEGTATLSASAPLTLSGGSLSAGTVLMNPGSQLTNTLTGQVSGAMLALAGSVIDATAANLTLGDAAKVNGFYGNGTIQVGQRTVTLADANDAALDSATLVTLGAGGVPGTLAAANGLTLNFSGNITGHGTINTPNNAAKPFINNGNLTGNSLAEPLTLPGYVKGVGNFDNVDFAGTFAPGFSPAKVNLGSADYNGTLQIEIGGLAPGSGHDQLNHILGDGIANLGGTLEVSLLGGFAPQAGQSFEIITAADITGTFANTILPALAGDLAWSINYGSNSVTIAVAAPGLPGDYNNNGTVDAADYVLWRKYQGTTHVLPNDPTGGTIGPTQYTTWRANFGKPPGSGSGSTVSAAVPEPTALILLMFAAANWCLLRNRAARRVPSTH